MKLNDDKMVAVATPDATKHETAATLTIHKAGDMTKRGRRRIAQWLRAQADLIEEQGSEYAPRFRARYMYPKSP